MRSMLTLAAAWVLSVPCSAEAPDPVALEAFVDGVVQTAMEDHHISGVVVSVVHGDDLLLEKGYGYAREPDGVKADPGQSLFRVASISKTFNATALMQLVEQGKVDLDADFTSYLPEIVFDLPLGSVRVRDLITHSAGFEDAYFGHFWAVDDASDHGLEDYVRRFQPAQVRPPGEKVVYSNYGTVVVGLIIERLAGQPYDDYMEQNVLRPLGMEVSTFRDWPGAAREGHLPEALEPRLARSYLWSGGRYEPDDPAWMHRGMAPAGSLITTAHEISRFMRAHLGDGSFDGGRILSPETLERMHGVLIRNHPGVAGNAHGFWANEIRGYGTLEHGGSIFGFMSDMTLIPELNLGIFVSTNAPDGYKLVTQFSRRVVERFFEPIRDVPRPDFASPEAAAETLSPYVGEYLPLRTGYTTVLKVAAVGMGGLVVGHNDDGYLTLTAGGVTSRYVRVDEDRFISPDTGARIAFSSSEPRLVFTSYGANAFRRIGFFGSGNFFMLVLVLLAIGMIGRVAAAWLRRRERLQENAGERIARLTSLLIVPAWIAWLVAFAVDLTAAQDMQASHFAHFPTSLGWVWVIAAIVGAVLSLVLAVGTVPVWRHGAWPIWRRIRYSLYTLLCLTLTWLLHYWNVLGVRTLG